MKKKALSYLLCTAMVFSMAACGNDSTDGGDSSQSDSSVEESTEESTEESSEESVEDSAEGEDQGEADGAGDDQQEETPEPVAEGPAAVKVEAESFEQIGRAHV